MANYYLQLASRTEFVLSVCLSVYPPTCLSFLTLCVLSPLHPCTRTGTRRSGWTSTPWILLSWSWCWWWASLYGSPVQRDGRENVTGWRRHSTLPKHTHTSQAESSCVWKHSQWTPAHTYLYRNTGLNRDEKVCWWFAKLLFKMTIIFIKIIQESWCVVFFIICIPDIYDIFPFLKFWLLIKINTPKKKKKKRLGLIIK